RATWPPGRRGLNICRGIAALFGVTAAEVQPSRWTDDGIAEAERFGRRRSRGTGPSGSAMPTLLWIECGACGGESMAILGAEGPGKGGDNLPDFLEAHDVRLLWHPSLSPESPKEAEVIIGRILAGEQELTLLCVAGSIIHGPDAP